MINPMVAKEDDVEESVVAMDSCLLNTEEARTEGANTEEVKWINANKLIDSIIVSVNGGFRIRLCRCGKITIGELYTVDDCRSCGMTNINARYSWNLNLNKEKKVMFQGDRLSTHIKLFTGESIVREDKKFHYKVYELSVNITLIDENRFEISEEKKALGEIRLDLTKGDFEALLYETDVKKENKGNKWRKTLQTLNSLWGALNTSEIEKMILTENNQQFWDAIRRLGFFSPSGIKKAIAHYPSIEILVNNGFGEHEVRHCIDYLYDKPAAAIEKVFDIPKWSIELFKKILKEETRNINSIRVVLKRISIDQYKKIELIFQQYSSERRMYQFLIKLPDLMEQGFNDLERLSYYVARDVRMFQGIQDPKHASELLIDYVKMSKMQKVDFEKYPKSLKKEHDIAAMNFQILEDKNRNQLFIDVTSETNYQHLCERIDRYLITAPGRIQDLVEEGKKLSHCVGSYVDDVIKQKSRIYFLREVEQTDKPLVTIEIRNNQIVQAKGFGNRELTREEKQSVIKWAGKHNIHYSARS